MKILFIAAVTPYPLNSGGQIRIYQLLKRLSKAHKITLFAYSRSHNESTAISELSQFCTEVRLFFRGRAWSPKYLGRALVTRDSLLAASYNHQDLFTEVSKRASEFDVIHAEPFYVHKGVPEGFNNKLVISEHNIEYEVYNDFANRYRLIPGLFQAMQLDVWKLKRAEISAWKRAAHVIAVSTSDAAVMKRGAPDLFVTVVPNCVDSEQYAFTAHTLKNHSMKFLFVGDFTWPPNIAAIAELLGNTWPSIVHLYPNAQLTVIGRGFPERLRDTSLKGVTVIPNVSDISQYYRDSGALIAPIHIAGGTKFKILEAMASGLPIVTTPEGIHGLSRDTGDVVFVAKRSEDYLHSIKTMLDNPEKVSDMTKRARRLVEQKYSWDVSAKLVHSVWEKIYETV